MVLMGIKEKYNHDDNGITTLSRIPNNFKYDDINESVKKFFEKVLSKF
jgi:hypothetical protein